MKSHWLFTSTLTLCLLGVLLLALTGPVPVAADNGPHGGDAYTATTDACAGCHRAHTALGPKLLTSATLTDFCYTCHGVLSGGANTDVKDGVLITGTNPSLRGGGFSFATMDNDWNGSAVSATVTSKHIISQTGVTVWGSGTFSTTSYAGASVTLECVTCHDPHGRAGPSGAATFRILRPSPNRGDLASVVTNTVNITDVTGTKYYTITQSSGKYYGQPYPMTSDLDTDTGKISGLSDWCAACHNRIHAGANAGNTSSGDALFTYRHRTNGSSVENNKDSSTAFAYGDTHVPACLTCHVVHGTSASHSGMYSNAVTVGTTQIKSALLRVDNRGVCELCHNK